MTAKKPTFAEICIAHRQRLNLTQEQFARLIGVNMVTINRWENSKHVPSEAKQRRLLIKLAGFAAAMVAADIAKRTPPAKESFDEELATISEGINTLRVQLDLLAKNRIILHDTGLFRTLIQLAAGSLDEAEQRVKLAILQEKRDSANFAT